MMIKIKTKVEDLSRILIMVFLLAQVMTSTVRASDPVVIETTKSIKMAAPVLGSQPYVTLLYRFSDFSDTPAEPSYFEGLVNSVAYPSANHYFKEISYNKMNINGSEVYGWYNLPGSLESYHNINDKGEYIMDVEAVIHDVVNIANRYVDFSKFIGINVMFNVDPLVPPFSTIKILAVDYVTRGFGFTFQGPWGFFRQDVTTHEILHNFGLMHSSGPYDETYDSQWDRMSAATDCPGTFPPHPIYGCMGVHTIAWHKHLLGWIPDQRCFFSGNNTYRAGIIKIDRLAFPIGISDSWAYAKLVVSKDPERFFTVEYRTWLGYDEVGGIPGEAVVIHYVRTALSDRLAQVVDPDNNGDPNDDAAMWLPGETYNSGVGIVAHVESMDAERAIVSLSNNAMDTVYVNGAYDGVEEGTIGNPWNTVAEGYASVIPSGIVYIQPGIYRETFKLSKPCKLKNYSSNMNVIIGQLTF